MYFGRKRDVISLNGFRHQLVKVLVTAPALAPAQYRYHLFSTFKNRLKIFVSTAPQSISSLSSNFSVLESKKKVKITCFKEGVGVGAWAGNVKKGRLRQPWSKKDRISSASLLRILFFLGVPPLKILYLPFIKLSSYDHGILQLGVWLVMFCDEINLPDMDSYGTQRVISFLRQMVEHNGFYRSEISLVSGNCVHCTGTCLCEFKVLSHLIDIRFRICTGTVLVQIPPVKPDQ